jgi:uncharacterized protein involved in propanediol utilization
MDDYNMVKHQVDQISATKVLVLHDGSVIGILFARTVSLIVGIP